jgi:hypothetical protein
MSTACCCPQCWNFRTISGNGVRIRLRLAYRHLNNIGSIWRWSPKFIWAPCHVMCKAILTGSVPATILPPPPPYLDSYYEGAIIQQRKTTSLCNPLLNTVSGYSMSLSLSVAPFFFFLPRHFLVWYTHKTSGFKTSGLQNVRFTKRQVSKRLVSKRPVFKFDILIKQKV